VLRCRHRTSTSEFPSSAPGRKMPYRLHCLLLLAYLIILPPMYFGSDLTSPAPDALSATAADASAAAASEPPIRPASSNPGRGNAFSVMAGCNQLFLGGVNLAVQYTTKDFAFEYSHGAHLLLNRLDSIDLNPDEKRAGLKVNVPWTTGFGIGYRLTEALHVSVEFKAHRFDETDPNGGARVSYTTISIGPGIFYDWHFWRGAFIQPALRWWPTVYSTLPGNEHTFVQANGSTVTVRSHDWGVFPNVSVGWTF